MRAVGRQPLSLVDLVGFLEGKQSPGRHADDETRFHRRRRHFKAVVWFVSHGCSARLPSVRSFGSSIASASTKDVRRRTSALVISLGSDSEATTPLRIGNGYRMRLAGLALWGTGAVTPV